MKWFRLYIEARNDAKLRTLTDGQHRVWFNLMCYAAEQEERGAVKYYDEELLAVEVANGDLELLRSTLERLQKLRIISIDNNTITFINFNKRQYDNPSDHPDKVRERVAKHRAKKRNENVTSGNALDTDTDSDTETDKENNIPPPPPEEPPSDSNFLASAFEKEVGHPLTQIENEAVLQLGAKHGNDIFHEALRISVIAGNPNLRYIEGILKSWDKLNLKSLQQIKEHEERRQVNSINRNRASPRKKEQGKKEQEWNYGW